MVEMLSGGEGVELVPLLICRPLIEDIDYQGSDPFRSTDEVRVSGFVDASGRRSGWMVI